MAQSDPRASALAAWYFGDGIAGETNPVTASGLVFYNITPTGLGARPERKTAQLVSGCFHAGTNLGVAGDQITVFLRARVPGGNWNCGLFAKRGSLATLNYNLFGSTDGNQIGFELRTSNSFVSLTFPVSKLDPAAWHNLVGRYDGTNAQLFCNDRLMASAPLTGNLVQNAEPTLIGAETDGGAIVRPFTGFIEEAALWNRALTVAELAYLNGLTATNETYPNQLLHYRHPDHDIGDAHIRWFNGRWSLVYMYLITNEFFQAELLTPNFLHWDWRVPTHAPVTAPDVLKTWFAIESVWDPFLNKWRSIWGYHGMRSSLSADRFNWYAASPQIVLPDPGSYRRFSDPAITQVGTNAWQMVITMAKTNLPWETGGSIGYATSSNLTQWTFHGDLYFPGDRGVPEVPTLFQMGNKWYLLASWYAGGVGRPTYQVADSPTGPWSEFSPNCLDGKDVCAATSEAFGTNRMLIGWIPLYAWNNSGQHWGGHLCFPRQIFQLTNGALRSRLPADFLERIRGPQLFPAMRLPSTKSGNWAYYNLGAQMDCFSGSGQNRTILPGLFDRFMADMTFTPQTGSRRVGWLLDWQETGDFFEVGMNQTNLFIRTAGGTVHADLSVPMPLNVAHRLRLIVEEDMVELVYDEQFTLAARIPKKLRTTSLGIFTEAGPVNFSTVAVHRLKNLETIPVPTTTSVSASASNSVYGTPVTFTARVTPWTNGPPTGNVVFVIDGVPQSPVALTPQGAEGVATISQATLSVNGGVPHSITAQFSGAAGFEPSSGTLANGHVVLPKPLAITGLSVVDKVYDGNTTASLAGTAQLLSPIPIGSGTASDGRPYTGETVFLSGSPSGTFARKNPGSGIPVSVSGLSLSGAQATNYTLPQPILSGTILPAGIIHVPSNQPTILAAVAAASPGFEIRIAAGTFNESSKINVNKPDLTLKGTGSVVRVPSNQDAVAEVASGVTGVVFDGLRFERPTADANWMRCVQLYGASAATFQNCIFTGPGSGVGVILFFGADATFQSCIFSNFNPTATWSAAIAFEARDATSPHSDLVVRDSLFGSGCNSWIRSFSWNPPKVGELTVSNCTFRAARGAHGIAFYHGSSTNNNTIYDPTKLLQFMDCFFEGTTLEIIEFHHTALGGPAGLQFRRCHFKPYNSTRKMFWLDIPAPILFENCLFGGGKHETIMTIWGGPPTVDFHHCTMINQGITAAESASGQNLSSFIWGWDGGRTFNVVNCLFYCPTNYSAAFSGDPGSSADRTYAVTHTVLDHPWVVGPKVQVVLGTGGYTNVSLAGAFVDPAGGDYHLVNGTPWVNGGTDLGYGWDLDRAARNQGGAPDLGAYEFPVAPVMPTVSIARTGENVVVHFTGVLQAADHVTGPFQDMPAAPNPFVLPPTNTARYWRARTP